MCGRADQVLSKCSGCKVMRYCSEACQRQHWKNGHRGLCKQHSLTLLKLARFDFNTFTSHEDWSFSLARPTLGAPDVAAKSPLFALEKLLNHASSVALGSDAVEFPLFGEELPLFGEELGSTFLHRSLLEFCRAVAASPDTRVHVVDMVRRSKDTLEEMGNTWLLDATLLWLLKLAASLPVQDVHWFVEAHDIISFGSVFDKQDWVIEETEDAVDVYHARHKATGVQGLFSDGMRVVADLAKSTAQAFPNSVILRVLRATANSSMRETIQKLATEKTPANVFTLWIREDLSVCGQFRPATPGQSLAERLLDSVPATLESRLRDMMGQRTGMVFDGANASTCHGDLASEIGAHGGTGSGEKRCVACREMLPKTQYSKTQWSKGTSRRCVQCTAAASEQS